MRIDVHNHFLPETYVDLLLEWDHPVGLEKDQEQLYMIHEHSGTASVKSGNRIPLNKGFTDIEVRREWMDEKGVGKTLVSVSTPNPYASAFTDEESTQLVKAINDGYAAVEDDHGDIIGGLGMVPLRDPDEAAAEVDRIANDLDLTGICLPTSFTGRKLSEPSLAPAFKRIEKHDLGVFIHPHGNALSPTLDDDETFMNPLVIFPIETTFQVSRLIFDGFFDLYDFDVVLSHMGGALLHLCGRLDRARKEMGESEGYSTPIPDYVQNLYFDAISFHRPALAAALETVGPNHMLFGTDYPFDEEDTETITADIEHVVEDSSDRKRIMSENAAAIFDI